MGAGIRSLQHTALSEDWGECAIPPRPPVIHRDAEGLQHASCDLAAIEVEAHGLGIHVPRIDADIYVPALPEGVRGSKNWMAARLAAGAGRVRGGGKAAAPRDNGKPGGRPVR
jgi:hypothetical protein